MTPIEEAKDYVRISVQAPAMRSDLPKPLKDKVKNSDVWLSHFKRVGDLLTYLKRFKVSNDDPIYHELKKHDLLTFEDIVPEFEKKFSPWANDSTRISDFIIGELYDAYDILIFSKTYDTRAGGMFVIAADGKPAAVVIKASLQGGSYPNTWIEEHKRLKYYLKSIDSVFGEHFKTNAAILNGHEIPILTFVRNTNKGPFIFRGVFQFSKIVREPNGSKYFELEIAKKQPTAVVSEAAYINRELENAVVKSLNSAHSNRLARLAAAPKKPVSVRVVTTTYTRNPDVIAEVLIRASGICEGCKGSAPFTRKSNGTPYLEVHHRVMLANGGDDTVENAIALCPNCHRKQHYG